MGQSASFPFEIGEEERSYSARAPQAYWALFRGKRKADGAAVSIFKLDKVNTPKLKLEAGLHGFQKMKSVRHPYILQYLEGADFEKEVVLVTEPIVPLKQWLSELAGDNALKEQQVAWGLRCLASALNFLNASNHMTHGLVCMHNVFVTKAGDWKLGGLDLLCEWRQGGKDIFHFQLHEALCPPEYRAPERRNNNMDLMLHGAPGALDIYALGQLLGEVVEATTEGKSPVGALASIQRRLMSDQPKDRPSAAQVIRHSYFSPNNKELIRVLEFLENFSLKETGEKIGFFQGLAPEIALLPPEVGIYKILPTFRDYVHVGAGGAGAVSVAPGQAPDQAIMQQQALQRQLLLAALPVCLNILKGLDEATFAEIGEPLVVSLFAMNDRALRAMLLQNLQPFSAKLSDATVNGKLFDSILAGFSDSAPQLRELTLKSMLCLSHRLNEKNLSDRLMKSLSKMQSDPEPSIRTNTTIFLGRIGVQLKEGVRARILLPAFLKACRDPFPHARLAGLKAATACTSYFDPPSIATKILPVVASLLIDPESLVRDAAFQCHDAYVKVLQAYAQHLKEEEVRRGNSPEKQGMAALLSGNGTDFLSGSASSSFGGLAQATSSVAAWGAQKMWGGAGAGAGAGAGSSGSGSGSSSMSTSGSGAGSSRMDLSGSGMGSTGAATRQQLPTSHNAAGAAPASGRRREDDEDFFDSLAPPSARGGGGGVTSGSGLGLRGGSGSRIASASAGLGGGWEDDDAGGGGNGWGDDDDDEGPSVSASFGSTKAAGTGPSLSVAALGGASGSGNGSGSGSLGTLGAATGRSNSMAQAQAQPPTSSMSSLKLGVGSGTSAPSSSSSLVKPVTDDDLFSMLNETGPKPSAYSLKANPSALGPPSLSGSSSSLSTSGSGGVGSARKPTAAGKSRLQAKKLDAKAGGGGSDWDDF